MPYGDPDHEQDLIDCETRELADERAGLDYGDPRRCKSHPQVIISSADGMFDGLCGICEAGADGAFDDPTPTTPAAPAPAPMFGPFEDDDIPF